MIEFTYMDKCSLVRDSGLEMVLIKMKGQYLNTESGLLLKYPVTNLVLHTSPQNTDACVVYILYGNH